MSTCTCHGKAKHAAPAVRACGTTCCSCRAGLCRSASHLRHSGQGRVLFLGKYAFISELMGSTTRKYMVTQTKIKLSSTCRQAMAVNRGMVVRFCGAPHLWSQTAAAAAAAAAAATPPHPTPPHPTPPHPTPPPPLPPSPPRLKFKKWPYLNTDCRIVKLSSPKVPSRSPKMTPTSGVSQSATSALRLGGVGQERVGGEAGRSGHDARTLICAMHICRCTHTSAGPLHHACRTHPAHLTSAVKLVPTTIATARSMTFPLQTSSRKPRIRSCSLVKAGK